MRIEPFRRRHVRSAAALAARNVAALRERVPLLPERWTAAAALSERITELIEANPAVVAMADGRLVGYMTARRVDWSQGRWAYSPEWASAAVGADVARIRQELYAALAEEWVADDRRAHFVSLLPNDGAGREALAWLGFGVTNIDGLRSVDALEGAKRASISVLSATAADSAAVAVLEQGLRGHLASTPLFLSYPSLDPAELAAKLADPEMATLLATDDRGPLAYMRIGPASSDASTIIRDAGTASITRAFTRPDRRGAGVATALLDAALKWARDNGYVRCAVDFESANLLASRFWPAHFAVVGMTLGRRL